MIVQSLLADPDLILLDEALEGLDVEERNHVMEQLQQLAERRIIILTSQIIAEIEHWLEQVIFMSHLQVTPSRTPDHWKISMLLDLSNSNYDRGNTNIKYTGEPTLEDVYFWTNKAEID